jgi:hypothetical protein
MSSRPRSSSRGSRRRWLAALVVGTVLATGSVAATHSAHADEAEAATIYPYTLKSDKIRAGFASDGSLLSIKAAGDLHDTEYLMNPTTAPDQAADPDVGNRQWLGNLMFSYANGDGAITKDGVGSTKWKTAWTTRSGDARTVTATPTSVTVTYADSKDPRGISGFTVRETYSIAADGSLTWKQDVTNSGAQRLVIGDWGMPVPGNELWKGGDRIYERRVLTHSYVGENGSYLTLERPSGQGPFVALTPDAATGSGLEYQDRWRTQEVGDTPWAWNEDKEGSMVKGLNVYYAHSMAIQKTNRGYLPSTSLALAPGATKSYTYHLGKVEDDHSLKQSMYDQGLLDTSVVPGYIVPVDRKAEMAFRVKGTITSVTAHNRNDLHGAHPTDPTVTFSRSNGDFRIYDMAFDRTQLGANDVTVAYTDQTGAARTSVLQFSVIDDIAHLLDMHAQFMVDKMQWTPKDGIAASDIRNYTFDDWMMNAKDGSVPTAKDPAEGRRNVYDGYWGLGDDWGYPHAEFLAEKQVVRPDAHQIQALDQYLQKAVWEHLMGNTSPTATPSYVIHDFFEQGKPGAQNDTPIGRGYAYPHIYNTFLSMYEVVKRNPTAIAYQHPAEWYLQAAYGVFKELYDNKDVFYNYATGLMGEQSTPRLIQDLRAEGMSAQADDIVTKMAKKYATVSAEKYPYGSEYTYDNTGEEAVYMLARSDVDADRTKALKIMRDIVSKTEADRGRMPIWYWNSIPTTITGENTWQFQYTAALAGYTMDDYINHTAALETGKQAVSPTRRAELQRLNYAGKVAELATVNAGQISDAPENIGASAWTYQSERGNLGTTGLSGGTDVPLLNGWRGMTGESDLGLWGAMQTLSADVVTDDPVFGTVAYGADVSSAGGSQTVVPKDGLQRRLHLVTQQLSVDLKDDAYSRATVDAKSTDLRLAMLNRGGTAHAGVAEVTGLASGTYAVVVNGVTQRTVAVQRPDQATDPIAQPTQIAFDAPAGATYDVHVVRTAG